jgi:hypothetical protein
MAKLENAVKTDARLNEYLGTAKGWKRKQKEKRQNQLVPSQAKAFSFRRFPRECPPTLSAHTRTQL